MLSLRAMEPEDLDLLYHIENDPQLWGVGVTNVPYSRYILHDYIAHASADIYTDRQLRLIVELSDSHATVGVVDLIQFDPRHRRAEVGIVIVSPQRRRGYARSALQSLARYAVTVLGLHQLYAIVAADNQAAIQLFRSSGYRHTATLPQWLSSGHTFTDALLMQLFLSDDFLP